MSRLFNVNYWRLVTQILPPLLRFPSIVSFLEAAFSPIDYLYGVFSKNRDSNLYNLSVTPQVCYLEKALNDRFDLTERRIYITDGVFYERLYIYTRAEDKPLYLYTRQENKPIYLYTRQEVGAESYDFIVNVPSGLIYNRDEMTAFVEMYKLASKLFTINEF
ncbi:MAG: hypothetical protein LBQ74_03935 [Prevotella sp.]|jgi:hypothetical protein|nr:hypothetical protein [Prevotella sp.]